MGIFKRVIGFVTAPGRQDPDAALATLQGLATNDPARAQTYLLEHFTGGPLEAAVDFDTPRHHDFAAAQLAIAAALAPGAPVIGREHFPPVFVASDADDGTWRAALAQAAQVPAAITFVRSPAEYEGELGVVGAIEGLRLMAIDASIAAVSTGNDYTLFRNAVLCTFAEELGEPFTTARFEAALEPVLVGSMGFVLDDTAETPLGYEVFIYRAA